MHRLAIWDMDRTLTRAPTWTPFLLHAARAQAPWRLALVPLAAAGTLPYAARLIDRARLKGWMQRVMLGGRLTPAAAQTAAASFADRVVATGVFAGARARLAADRADGFRLVMATASFRFYAGAIAERLGFDDVVATESRLDDAGVLLSGVAGENCYGAAKLRLVEAWLAREGIARRDARVRCYSDHVSDAPLLAWSDEPFAVNPHERLRRLAEVRGWPVLDWA